SLDSDRVDGRDAHGVLGLSDVAVLYRTDAQARPVMAALTRAGLPFQKRSHDRLLDRPGVAAIVRDLRYRGAGGAPGSVRERLTEAARAALDLLPAGDAGEEERREVNAALDLMAPLADRCEDTERFLTELTLGAE